MARGGRPALPPSERRSQRVVAHLTPDEYSVLKDRARAFGVSASELARRAITKVKLAAPVSAQNVKWWGDVGRLGSNLNQSTRALNDITKHLKEREGAQGSGGLAVDVATGQRLVELAEENAQIVAELTEVMIEIRALLMDQWKGNIEDVLSGEGER